MTEWASLAVGWLLVYLVHSSLLLATVWGVERFGRIRSGALLTGLWRAAFFGAIVTASLQTVLATSPLQGRLQLAAAVPAQPIPMQSIAAGRSLPKPGPVGSSPNIAEQTIAGAAPTLHAAVNRAQASPAKPSVLVALASWSGRHWLWFVVATWFAVALMLFARVGFGVRAARRELVGRRRLHDGSAFDTLAELSRQAGSRHAPRLSSSSSLMGPVSLPNGEIVLPLWTLERLAPNQLRVLLAQELAHCRRHDPQWRFAETLTRAFLFFQPLNWLARTRLCAGAELASDDWAAAHTGDRRALAECLVECAARLHSSRLPDFASAMAAPRSQLAHRIARLTGGMRPFHGEIGMKTRIAIIVVLAVAAFLAPGFLIAPSFAKSSVPPPSSVAPALASAQARAARQAQAAREQAKAAAQQVVAAEKQAARARIDLQKAQSQAERRAMRKAEVARHKEKAALTQRQVAREAQKRAEQQAEVAARQTEAEREGVERKAEAAAHQAEAARKRAEAAEARSGLRKAQAEMAAQQAQLKAEQRAMQEAAEAMRKETEAMRKEAKAT